MPLIAPDKVVGGCIRTFKHASGEWVHYMRDQRLSCVCRGQHEAKRLGAALISRNIADILLDHFQEHGKQLRVLVYCWRGGERSQSLAHVLSRVGWEVGIIKRGYMGYRNQVSTRHRH